jgi:hypothetical protein
MPSTRHPPSPCHRGPPPPHHRHHHQLEQKSFSTIKHNRVLFSKFVQGAPP